MSAPSHFTPPSIQMARDAIELMTQEQRVAFAIEIALGITAPHCSQHLIRLARQAEVTSHEIEGQRLLDQQRARA